MEEKPNETVCVMHGVRPHGVVVEFEVVFASEKFARRPGAKVRTKSLSQSNVCATWRENAMLVEVQHVFSRPGSDCSFVSFNSGIDGSR